MVQGFMRLKELKETQGDLAKVKYVEDNIDDKLFIHTLNWLLSPLTRSNISRTKWDKAIPEFNENLKALFGIEELIDYLNSITGKNEEVNGLKYFVEDIAIKEVKDVLEGIINKDYKVDIGLKSLCHLKEFVKVTHYLGCQSYSDKKLDNLLTENDWLYAEVKNDGQFSFAYVYENKVVFYTRKGIEQRINGLLNNNLLKLREFTGYDFVLTGELLIAEYENRDKANGIIRGLSASNFKVENGDGKETSKFEKKNGIPIEEVEARLQYIVWDLIPMDNYINGLDITPYIDRRTSLANIINLLEKSSNGYWNMVKQTDGIIVNSKKDIFEYFYYNLEKGLEGIVLKSPKTIFKDGKPKDQLKFKIEFNCELKIVGFKQGEVKTRFENTLGSLLCQSEDSLLETGVSGLSDELRDEIWNNKDLWLNKVITVKCNGTSTNVNGGTSLRYANFKLDRSHEKTKADTLLEILENEKSCLSLDK